MNTSSAHSAAQVRVGSDPAAIVAAVENLGTIHKTPCGRGELVWHHWGKGPAVLLLHGGAGSWSHWLRNIEALSANYSVWAPDMPGFGDSAEPPEPSIDVFLETIERGWQGLNPGSGPVSVIGFSLGAAIAIPIAARLKSGLANLVLAGPRLTSFMGSADLPLISWRRLETAEQRLAAHRQNLEMMMLGNPASIDDLAVYLQSTNAERMRVQMRKWKPGSRDRMREYFPRLKPSGTFTVVYGTGDQGAGPIMESQGADLKAVHPDVGLHFLEGMGHWVQYEAAERFNAIALDALAGKASSPPIAS
jgi:pimeloyl-ACP methyl ester carboxylesterase